MFRFFDFANDRYTDRKLHKYFNEGGTSIITGKTGSGKTSFSVALARMLRKRGIPVFSNVESPYSEKIGNVFSYAHHKHECHGVVILDELAGANVSAEAIGILSRHLVQARKRYGLHWVFIAQDYRFFPIEIRRLALRVYECYKGFGQRVSIWEQDVYERSYAVGGAVAGKVARPLERYRTVRRIHSDYDSYSFVDVSCFCLLAGRASLEEMPEPVEAFPPPGEHGTGAP